MEKVTFFGAISIKDIAPKNNITTEEKVEAESPKDMRTQLNQNTYNSANLSNQVQSTKDEHREQVKSIKEGTVTPSKTDEHVQTTYLDNNTNESISYKLPFRHNCSKPPNRYSQDHEEKSTKYPIANHVSTQHLSQPLKAFCAQAIFGTHSKYNIRGSW